MPADAAVTAWLLGEKLPGDVSKAITKFYEDCIEGVPKNSRVMDSVADNLRLLARFLKYKNKQDTRATILTKVADKIDPRPGASKKSNPKKITRSKPVRKKRKTRK